MYSNNQELFDNYYSYHQSLTEMDFPIKFNRGVEGTLLKNIGNTNEKDLEKKYEEVKDTPKFKKLFSWYAQSLSDIFSGKKKLSDFDKKDKLFKLGLNILLNIIMPVYSVFSGIGSLFATIQTGGRVASKIKMDKDLLHGFNTGWINKGKVLFQFISKKIIWVQMIAFVSLLVYLLSELGSSIYYKIASGTDQSIQEIHQKINELEKASIKGKMIAYGSLIFAIGVFFSLLALSVGKLALVSNPYFSFISLIILLLVRFVYRISIMFNQKRQILLNHMSKIDFNKVFNDIKQIIKKIVPSAPEIYSHLSFLELGLDKDKKKEVVNTLFNKYKIKIAKLDYDKFVYIHDSIYAVQILAPR